MHTHVYVYDEMLLTNTKCHLKILASKEFCATNVAYIV